MANKVNLTADKKVLIISCVVVIIMAALVFLQLTALREARETLAAEQTALLQDRSRLARIQDLRGQEAEFLESLAAIEHLLPDRPGEDEFIRYLQATALNAGITLQQVRFQERVAAKEYVEMPFNAMYEGSYNGTAALLESLRSGQRIVRVDSVRVARGSGSAMRVDLNGQSFYSEK